MHASYRARKPNFKFGSWVVAYNVLVDIEVCG